MSFSKTAVLLAQKFPGARRFPYLRGIGQFGDRHGRGAGSPRYISIALSPIAKIILPPEDMYILTYVFEDGERCEPLNFCPVVPMSILESYECPSEGWRHGSMARDQKQVLAIVDAFIDGDEDIIKAAELITDPDNYGQMTPELQGALQVVMEKWPLDMSLEGFDCEIRSFKDADYVFSKYVYEQRTNIVRVLDLPPGVQTAKYVESINNSAKLSKYVKEVESVSPPKGVDIEIRLLPGAYDEILANYGKLDDIDAIEDAFNLRKAYTSYLNYYGLHGGVLEFAQCYHASLLCWAVERRDLYAKRIVRQRILAELREFEESEILRYIKSGIDLKKAKTDDEAHKMLEKAKFSRIDATLLQSPKYTDNEDIETLVKEGKNASYGYLMNIQDRQRIQHNVDLRTKRKESYAATQVECDKQLSETPTPGGSVWKSEIAQFVKLCN